MSRAESKRAAVHLEGMRRKSELDKATRERIALDLREALRKASEEMITKSFVGVYDPAKDPGVIPSYLKRKTRTFESIVDEFMGSLSDDPHHHWWIDQRCICGEVQFPYLGMVSGLTSKTYKPSFTPSEHAMTGLRKVLDSLDTLSD